MSGKNSFPVVNIFQIFKYFNHITRLGPVNSQASMNVAFHKIFHLMSLDFLMINLICLGSLSYSCCLFFFVLLWALISCFISVFYPGLYLCCLDSLMSRVLHMD